MIVMFTMDRLTLKVRCMVLETCYLRMDSAIKECSTVAREMASASPLTCQATSIRVSTEKGYVRAKAFSKRTMESCMKGVGATTRCMDEAERPSITESAS